MDDTVNLKGCGTALITPFTSSGELDERALKSFVTWQVEEGIDFLVPCGTTGETATLRIEERLRVVELVLEQAGGRVPVIAGAGGYDTAGVIEQARAFQGLGVDGILSVTPYYNKPPQKGLYQHFAAIADAVDLPIVLYNVPGRTGSNLEPATVVELAKLDNVIGIKEASGDIAQIGEVIATTPDEFRVLSGDDALAIPVIALGGVGVISVVSNEMPELMTKLVSLCLESQFRAARGVYRQLLPLMKINFIESNPIPVKAALAIMGHIEESYRLPLTPLSSEHKEKLWQVLASMGVL